MGAYGLARGLPSALIGPWMASPTRSLAFSRAVDGQEALVRRLNGLALLGACLVLIGLWWRGAGS
jgi:hypothetical protein